MWGDHAGPQVGLHSAGRGVVTKSLDASGREGGPRGAGEAKKGVFFSLGEVSEGHKGSLGSGRSLQEASTLGRARHV